MAVARAQMVDPSHGQYVCILVAIVMSCCLEMNGKGRTGLRGRRSGVSPMKALAWRD